MLRQRPASWWRVTFALLLLALLAPAAAMANPPELLSSTDVYLRLCTRSACTASQN